LGDVGANPQQTMRPAATDPTDHSTALFGTPQTVSAEVAGKTTSPAEIGRLVDTT